MESDKMLGRSAKWGWRTPFRSNKKRMRNIENRDWQEQQQLEEQADIDEYTQNLIMLEYQNKFDNHWVVKYMEDQLDGK